MLRILLFLSLLAAGLGVRGQGQVLLAQDFAGSGLPSGWSRSQAPGSIGWQVGDSASLSGTFWRIPARGRFAASNDDICSCDMSQDLLISPAVDTRAQPALFLQFAAYYDGIFGSQGTVLARSHPDAAWEEVFSLPPTGTWTVHTLDLRPWAGAAALQLAFRHDDGGGWGTGVAIDDILLFVPPARDLSLHVPAPPAFLRPGFLDFIFTVSNQGTEPVTSYQLGWQVDQNPPQLAHIGAGRLAPLADTTHLHPLPWVASEAGTYTLRLWLAQPNGAPDQAPADDSLVFTVTVIADAPPRPVLVESYTQHNCQTCAQQNPGFHDRLDQLRDQVAPLTYHATWPLGNNDPMHLFNPPAHQARLDFYQIGGVPYALLEAHPVTGGSYTGAPDGLESGAVQRAAQQPGLYRLALSSTPSNGLVNVAVSVEALHSPPDQDPRLYIAVVQDSVVFAQPTGVNGEQVFPHVLRYFLPNAGGTSLAGLSPGQSQVFPVSWQPVPALYGATQRVVAWVQDGQSRTVWAVARSAGTYLCPDGTAIALDWEVTPAACDGSGGAATLSLTGGQGPYQVGWPDGQQALSRTGLATGWYPVQVTAASGCTFATEVRIPPAAGPELRPVVTPVSCPGGQDGAIRLQALSPAASYQYAWDHGPTQAELSGLAPGSYRATVTAADGCTTTLEATVTAPDPVQLAYHRTPDDGNGSGSVTVFPRGGTAPFTFLWDDGSTGSTRRDLSAGPFSLSLTDYRGCAYGPFTEYIWTTSLDPAAEGIHWQLFPNPAQGQAHLRVALAQPAALTYALYDAQGRVWRRGQQGPATTHAWTIGLTGLAAGHYWLQVQGPGLSQGQWLQVQP